MKKNKVEVIERSERPDVPDEPERLDAPKRPERPERPDTPERPKRKNGSKKAPKKVAVASWVLVALWMVAIFVLSSDDGEISSYRSNQLLVFLTENMGLVLSESFIGKAYAIRKFAHFFEYFVLGIFAVNAIVKTSEAVKRPTMRSTFHAAALSLAFCSAYAVTDELHQLFVPGRAASGWDVLIDTAGAAVGIMIFSLVRMLLHSIRKRRSART